MSSLSDLGGLMLKDDVLRGNCIALVWQTDSHALHPFRHFSGCMTTAFPFCSAKTAFGQYSTHRGVPVLMQPSHLSEKIIGNQGLAEVENSAHLYWVLSSVIRTRQPIYRRSALRRWQPRMPRMNMITQSSIPLFARLRARSVSHKADPSTKQA